MKKFLAAWLSLMLIIAPTVGCKEDKEPVDPFLENFRASMDHSDFCAAAHFGYLDGTYYEIMAHIEDQGMLEAFPFLEIPEENFIEFSGGELYAIVPYDADAVTSVYHAVLDETTFTVVKDQLAGTFEGGEPILIKCNVSEIIPNVIVEITEDGITYAFSPCLSGEDGHMVAGGGIYDFSSYDAVFPGAAEISPNGAKG